MSIDTTWSAIQEPNPADDLNGADVARKLTILSRLVPSLATSLPSGYKSVETHSLIPAEIKDVESGLSPSSYLGGELQIKTVRFRRRVCKAASRIRRAL